MLNRGGTHNHGWASILKQRAGMARDQSKTGNRQVGEENTGVHFGKKKPATPTNKHGGPGMRYKASK